MAFGPLFPELSATTLNELVDGYIYQNSYVGTPFQRYMRASGAYDPFGGAYAFSLIGTSGTVEQGTGETETARENTAFKYLLNYNGLRASAIAQVGGWSDGNGAQAARNTDQNNQRRTRWVAPHGE